MKKQPFKPIGTGKAAAAAKLPASARAFERVKPVIPPIDPVIAVQEMKKFAASMDVPDDFPEILEPHPSPQLIATFTVCGKTGTALYLDIWDCDHFDYASDMGRNLSDCRVWFSGDEFPMWGSRQTKTGVINCHFRAPEAHTYRCDATLQSFGGPATVRCELVGVNDFGMLTFNGTRTQPHSQYLTSGNFSFRISQVSGSFFFVALSVYAI